MSAILAKIKALTMKVVTSGQDPDEGSEAWYRRMWAVMEIRPESLALANRVVDMIVFGRRQYDAAERVTGVPWWVIGTVFYLEADCDFSCCLHNGDKIIGTWKKTYNVPAGRGPFATWVDSAKDAINMNGSRWEKIKAGVLEVGSLFFAVERYNGTGYISGSGKAETSPYLWAGSNVNDGAGKYVADGKFSPTQTTLKKVGFAVVAKILEERGLIKFEQQGVIQA